MTGRTAGLVADRSGLELVPKVCLERGALPSYSVSLQLGTAGSVGDGKMQTLVTGIRAQRRFDLGASSRIPSLAQLGGDALPDELFRLIANGYPGDSSSDIEDTDGSIPRWLEGGVPRWTSTPLLYEFAQAWMTWDWQAAALLD